MSKKRGRIEATDRRIEKRPLGVFDEKGREVGQMLICWEEEVISDQDSNWLFDAKWHGKTRYCFEPSAMRDGRAFGAIAKTSYFETAAGRDAYAEKAHAACRKRFEKKFGVAA